MDWTQEQLIPNTFVGGYQSFTPDASGFVFVEVTGQGALTEAQLGLALVGDSIASTWVAGGSYIYSQDNSIYWLPGSATFPV
ncbi:MAG TPA: hypothetical protein VEX86_07520, partial [Longimicrobium sp.]|nr:hypothetical protein [Longimicrobium sp.]